MKMQMSGRGKRSSGRDLVGYARVSTQEQQTDSSACEITLMNFVEGFHKLIKMLGDNEPTFPAGFRIMFESKEEPNGNA
jgi:hypothetical protein